ncbi:Hypothetical_protein [Hexamita inflata]|uniref:Hypothetical_protein n=1 Tax=Hexamita inflata TaxID=28002 RepID=A0AA86PEX5_9EUKA|nr:Hypothetical protein HINF_LOCUS20520 [Hexamita inflata]CAI9934547.1 Hypothetical protein HINF_LOCUS22192 [Hexamita inflata]
MAQRKRISREIEQQLEENFVLQVNKIYSVNTTNIQEALEYYQQLTMGSKRVFSWKTLDNSIGHSGYPTKSYSYKYVNEVVAGRFSEKLSPELKYKAREHACDLFRSKFSLMQKTDRLHFLELRAVVIKETVSFVEKQVQVSFCKKSLTDMLRNALDEQIQIKQNKEQIQQNGCKYTKQVQFDQDEVMKLLKQSEDANESKIHNNIIENENQIQNEQTTFMKQIEELMLESKLKAIENHIRTTK